MFVAVWSRVGSADAGRRLDALIVHTGFRAVYGSVVIGSTEPPNAFGDCSAMVGWTWRERSVHDDPNALATLGGNYCLVRAENDGLTAARGSSAGPSLYVRSERDAVLVSTHFGVLARQGGSVDVSMLSALVTSAVAMDDRRTVLREVRRVPGYSALRFRDGSCHVIDGVRPALVELHGSPDALAERLDEAIGHAVDRATAGHRRVAVMVGGIDSSIVLGHVHRAGLDAVPVTLDFPGPRADIPHVLVLCAHLGLVPVRVTPRDCASFARRGMVADRAPCPHATTALQIGLQVAAQRAGATVVLSGVGGDEVFGGRGRAVALLDACRYHDIGGARHVLAAGAPHEALYECVRRLAGSLAPVSLRRLHQRRQARKWVPWAGRIAREEQEHAFERNRARYGPPSAAGSSAAARYEALEGNPDWSSFADQRDRLNTDFLPRVDPLFDDEVVRLMASLRPAALFHSGRDRGLARHSARAFLPESVRVRLDKAQFEPALAAMAAPMSQFDELARVSRLADLGIIDPARFWAAYEIVRNDRGLHSAGPLWLLVWATLSAESYLQGEQ